MSNNVVIVDSFYGDSGKGKVSDAFSEVYDYSIRFNGGNNAGHTIVREDGKVFKLNHIPAGVLNGKISVLGNGMVINPATLLDEINMLKSNGIDLKNKLFISDNAHVILQKHIDAENSPLSDTVGTTKRGIGYAYADKIMRTGLRIKDLYTNNTQYDNIRDEIKEYVTDTRVLLYKAYKDNKDLLFEGAQGTFLDIDHGDYPYVTSSNTLPAQASLGTGLPIQAIQNVLGVVKTYSTRVGNGKFPTELKGSVGEDLRKFGHEYGTTTGRDRRCGWLDLPSLQLSHELNGYTSLCITKLDILSNFDTFYACIDYDTAGFPIYKEFNSWKEDISKIELYSKLPDNAKRYVEFISNFINVPIHSISTGAKRNEIVYNIRIKNI